MPRWPSRPAAPSHTDRSTAQELGILGDQTKLAPFYTDNSMQTLRSENEVRQAYNGMSAGDQDQMKQRCIDMQSGKFSADESPSLQDLCGMVQSY